MVCDDINETCVVVPIPRRSLVILSGQARFLWKHAVLRSDIISRRIGITFRELSSEFLPGGAQEAIGRDIIKIANTFCGKSVGELELAKKNTIENTIEKLEAL